MAQRRQGSGAMWRWAAVAAFVAGFVLPDEIGPSDVRAGAAAALVLLAATYVLGPFLLGREGGGPGRALREFLALGGAFVLIVGYSPVAEYMAAPLLVRPDVDRGDAIVVLPGGVHLNGTLTSSSLGRLLYAAGLYRRGLAPRLILSGGTAGDAPRAEGDVMADFARQIGVPAGAILVERASHNTYEEAVEVARLLRERGLRRPLLVTDATHMYRAQLAFRRQGVEVLPAPAQTREGLQYAHGGEMGLFYAALHEYGGLVYYKARGRI